MKFTCVGAYTDGKCLWLPSKEMNALYNMDIFTKEIKYIGVFPDCLNDMSWTIKKVTEYHDKVFFFSANSYQIWGLDKATNNIETYIGCNQSAGLITNVEIIQDEAWIIPNNFISPIVCFDLQKKVGSVFQWDKGQYRDCGTGSFTRTAKLKNKIYFATRNKDDIHLCVLDCEQKKMTVHDIRELSLVNCIGIKDDKLWMFGENRERKNVFLKYDIHTLQCAESYESMLSEELMEKGGLQYFSMGIFQDSLILNPAWAKKIILYDLDSNEEKYIEYPDEFSSILEKVSGVIFDTVMCLEGKIYFMPYLIPKFLVLDMKDLTFQVTDMEVDEIEYVKALKEICSEGGMNLYESRYLSIRQIFTAMKNEDNNILNRKQTNTGMKIFRNL